MIGATTGLTVVLVALLAAVETLVGLHATTVASTAASTAARTVASASVDHTDPASLTSARREGERRARELLGRSADTASFEWEQPSDEQVRVRVAFAGPSLVGTGPFATIERSAAVATESLR